MVVGKDGLTQYESQNVDKVMVNGAGMPLIVMPPSITLVES